MTESELVRFREELRLRNRSLRDLGFRLYLVAAILAVLTLMLLL